MKKISLVTLSFVGLAATAALYPYSAQGEVTSNISSKTKSSINIETSDADVVVEQKISNHAENSIYVTQYVESNGKVLKDETTVYPVNKSVKDSQVDREKLKEEIKDQAKGEIEVEFEKAEETTEEAKEEIEQELEAMKEELDQEFTEMDKQLEQDLSEAERNGIRDKIRSWWERFNKWIDERFN